MPVVFLTVRDDEGGVSKRRRATGLQITPLPQEIIDSIESAGFFESIPLWAVTLIGGLAITVLSFIMIMSVYGIFFRQYLYTAIVPDAAAVKNHWHKHNMAEHLTEALNPTC